MFVSVIPDELDVLPLDDASGAQWWSISDVSWDDLAFDHALILEDALPIAENLGLYD